MQNPSQFPDLYLQYLNQHPFLKRPGKLYEPIDYIMKLGGKRLRPQLVLWGHFLFDESVEVSLPIAHAVEVFHNFSLVHDDVMDEADLRRGKPTVHKAYDLNTAILSGDVMLIYAYEYLLKVNSDKSHELVKAFNRMAIEVCEGQQLDMNFETMEEVELKAYLEMIEKKTAALLGGALYLGAIAAGANHQNALNLDSFGRKMGLAFQIQDDLLDAFGDPSKFGKKVGGDIIQNKKTFLYLKALELGNKNQQSSLRVWFKKNQGDEQEKISAVMKIFEEVGIKQITLDFQESLIEEAKADLKKVDAPLEAKDRLFEWAERLVVRNV